MKTHKHIVPLHHLKGVLRLEAEIIPNEPGRVMPPRDGTKSAAWNF